MKKILWAPAFILIIVTSCNKSQDSVVPSNDQKVLGMVLEAPVASTTGLILLKDGRAIKPVSGFNESTAKAGNKFVLSFELLSSTGKVLNVRVTSYSSAADSTFVPAGSSDSTATKVTLQGSFTGTFTYATVDYSHPADTTKIIDSVTVNFDNSNYEATYTKNNEAGGSGTFAFDETNSQMINFSDPKLYPGYDKQILNGQYYVMVIDATVVIWKYTNYNYSGYVLKK